MSALQTLARCHKTSKNFKWNQSLIIAYWVSTGFAAIKAKTISLTYSTFTLVRYFVSIETTQLSDHYVVRSLFI